MSGFSWRTAGESHGKALLAIVEGVPSGLPLDPARIDADLARRQRGYGRGGRMRIEADQVEVLSGVRAGTTIGSPIALCIANRDATIERLPVPTNPRPGHADLAGCLKHGHRDPRAVLERSSARETAARVACGAVARLLLAEFDVEVFAAVVELGGIAADPSELARAWNLPRAEREARREASEFFAVSADVDPRWHAEVDDAKAAGDTLGGVFEVRVFGLPPGLGGYANPADRLTSRLCAALLSIPAMKGVEVGDGFALSRARGSVAHDPIQGSAEGGGPLGSRYKRPSNRAGGLEGGMTTGEPLVLRTAMKPIPTLRRGLPSVEFASLEPVEATYQRSDVTSVPAASVVGEAVVALELARAFLEKFGGDSLDELRRAYCGYLERLRQI